MVAFSRAHIRLGTHPDRWKSARGVTILKTGKDDYSLAKSTSASAANLLRQNGLEGGRHDGQRSL